MKYEEFTVAFGRVPSADELNPETNLESIEHNKLDFLVERCTRSVLAVFHHYVRFILTVEYYF